MTTLAHSLRSHYETAPDRIAITLQFAGKDDMHLTTRDLTEGAAGFARALQNASVPPGGVVILIQQHSRELVCAFWGAILHGAIPAIMPFLTEKLSPEKYRHELAALIEITRPSALVTYAAFEDEARRAVGDGNCAVIVQEGITPAAPDFASLRGMQAKPSDIVLLQHSSGSTGLQKGVALSHRAVLNQIAAYAPTIELSEQDTIVSWLPLYHDMGLIACFVMPVVMGTRLVLLSPFEWVRGPHRLFSAITKYGGTHIWLPNFALNFCAQKIRDRDLEGVDLTTLRRVVNCSEPMFASSHDIFIRRFVRYGMRPSAVVMCYAMAENTFAVSQSAGGDFLVENGRPSAGKVLPFASARILGAPDGAGERDDLREGEVGEIAIRSNCMLSGYYHRDDLTAGAFYEGYFLTGDLGYLRGEHLFVSGRKKDLIIVGGKNVYPQDLEQIVNDVPGVHAGRVVAFGVMNDAAGTEDVCILAEADTTDEDERAAIAAAIRQAVTQNSDVAARFVELFAPGYLFKTSSGKIARAANKERWLAGAGD
ncbi:MAG: AMP-binding protein [Anaerolineae bacterium]